VATNISASVGKGGSNQYSDVVLVQLLLNNHIAFDARLSGKVAPLVADGKIDGWSSEDPTVKAIRAFQKHVLGFKAPDGRVDRIKNPSDPTSGMTLRWLSGNIMDPIPDPKKTWLEFKIASVSWISRHPNPVNSAAMAKALDPEWVPMTYMGLVATSNAAPGAEISDFHAFGEAGDFRGLMYLHVRVICEGKHPQRKVAKVELVDKILDPGWTPPFDTGKFPLTKLLPDPDIADRTWYRGEMSPLSDVVVGKRHPNSVIDIPPDEVIVANGLVKFRAGAHTDQVGIDKVKCPNHVPWVWCETALTYDGEDFKLYGQGAQFPSHAWYKNGKQLFTRDQVGDMSFPLSGNTINLAALKLYSVIATGARREGPQPAASSDASHGPVDAHHYSVAAGARKVYGR
jgi:hypothetical protein